MAYQFDPEENRQAKLQVRMQLPPGTRIEALPADDLDASQTRHLGVRVVTYQTDEGIMAETVDGQKTWLPIGCTLTRKAIVVERMDDGFRLGMVTDQPGSPHWMPYRILSHAAPDAQ